MAMKTGMRQSEMLELLWKDVDFGSETISIRKTKAKKIEIGIPELTFHTLRHNFASELIAKGCDVRTVQAYMGHSSLRMLQRYAHVNKSIWRSSIQLLGTDIADGSGAEKVSAPRRQ